MARALSARLLVAADGAASPLRAMAGIGTRGRDYRQRGVVAHVGTERPHQHTAWQRFLPGGPLALLPLADGRSSIVWSLPEAEAERVLALDEPGFLRALGVASDFRLGRITATSATRRAFRCSCSWPNATRPNVSCCWAMRRMRCIRWPGRA